MCQFNLDVRKVLDPVHLVHKPWGTLPLFLWHLSLRWPILYICIYLYILPFSFMSDLVISVHTSDQKVRKFATKEPKLLKNYIGLKKVHYRRFFSILNVFSWALRGLQTIWWQLQFTGGLWFTTWTLYFVLKIFWICHPYHVDVDFVTVYRWVGFQNLNLVLCFENILNLSSLSYWFRYHQGIPHRSTTPWGSFSLSSVSLEH